MKMVARLPAAKLRARNRLSGSIGCGARRSHSTNATSETRPTTSGTSTIGESQPYRSCSMSANTVPPSPTTPNVAPSQSMRSRFRFGSSRPNARISTSTTAMGRRLIQNAARQETRSTSMPPKSGPIRNALVVHAVHRPIARPCSDFGNVATMSASELGTSSAPAAPCSARPSTKTGPVGASAQSTDVAAKP